MTRPGLDRNAAKCYPARTGERTPSFPIYTPPIYNPLREHALGY